MSGSEHTKKSCFKYYEIKFKNFTDYKSSKRGFIRFKNGEAYERQCLPISSGLQYKLYVENPNIHGLVLAFYILLVL